MEETSLHPPPAMYGSYEIANGFDLLNDGVETPFNVTLLEGMDLLGFAGAYVAVPRDFVGL